ncbi:MAG: hypothetical protein PVG20_04675 [Thioalkalispiraceae bacterium]|jgi:hypothetical protein
MLGITAVKWVLVLFLFVVLPIALMRYMVRKTIEVTADKHQR